MPAHRPDRVQVRRGILENAEDLFALRPAAVDRRGERVAAVVVAAAVVQVAGPGGEPLDVRVEGVEPLQGGVEPLVASLAGGHRVGRGTERLAVVAGLVWEGGEE